ncbi:MAG: hypothetical protein K9L70_03155 [Thiohalocapsa sp.]|nr:hypothetical protein [Thiohalocapsa sp.]MCF7990116.1 hypothetical protein [Thiohalocapsa sp.]
MTIRPIERIRTAAATGALALALGGIPWGTAAGAILDLRLLVVSTGNADEDLALDYIDDYLDQMGVPYDLLDASRETLTFDTLERAAGEGKYNGIIITVSDLLGEFTPDEWTILHDYETRYGVRESVLSGWPARAWDNSAPWGIYLDYGITNTGSGTFENDNSPVWACYGEGNPSPVACTSAGGTQTWAGSIGGDAVFEYINLETAIPITDWAFAGIPRVDDGFYPRDGTIPSVEPLLTVPTANGEPTTNAVLSIVRYCPPDDDCSANGGTPQREVLYSSISNAWFLLHSQILAYEFINFATKGVFIGGRQVHLTAHLDDLFFNNDLWDPINNITDPSTTHRLNSADIADAVLTQAAFRANHPTVGADFKLDFPFNGEGAQIGEELTDAIVANKDQFRYINHTYSHADMDTPHPELTVCDYETQTYSTIRGEIRRNRQVWRALGLPDLAQNNRVLVSGNHSGLKDRNCTDMGPDPQVDDIDYPQGANPAFLQAAQDTRIKYLASDSSQVGQDVEQYISSNGVDYSLLMLPRYPTNIFFNTVTPEALTDEYNYVFRERYLEMGQDPCTIPGAVCEARDYRQILEAEADLGLRHMLSYRNWAHYFHQSNLGVYDGQTFATRTEGTGTLMFDWLEAVVGEYESYFTLPILNLPYYALGDETRDRLAAREANIQGTWNTDTDEVTLVSDRTLYRVVITGLDAAASFDYGGQVIGKFNLTANTPKVVPIDRALDR